MRYFNRLIFYVSKDQWILLIFGTEARTEVEKTIKFFAIVRFVFHFFFFFFFFFFEQHPGEQHGVKISSFWDTQYNNYDYKKLSCQAILMSVDSSGPDYACGVHVDLFAYHKYKFHLKYWFSIQTFCPKGYAV